MGLNRDNFNRASRVIPTGFTSNYRKGEDAIVYFDHGVGGRLYDLDGNEYLDHALSHYTAILGHSSAPLREAVSRQVGRLYTNEPNKLEVEAAELICEHIPSAEKVYFATTGSEAVALALRIARAYTGKNMIVRFTGQYHGSLDALLGGVVDDPLNPVIQPGTRPNDPYSQQFHTEGRANGALSDSFMVEWNDIGQLNRLMDLHGSSIAAVLMEPVMTTRNGCWPLHGYLEAVKALCKNHHVVLIFDEIITGFRMGLGGAQGNLGVIPDLTVLAKALGGGVPISAVCGSEQIMETVARDDVSCSGTYNGSPIGLAAAIATISELSRDGGAAMDSISRQGLRLAEGLRSCFSHYKIPFILQGFPGAWSISWSPQGKIINYADALRQQDSSSKLPEFLAGIKAKRVLSFGTFHTCAAHTAADIDETIEIADRVCRSLV